MATPLYVTSGLIRPANGASAAATWSAFALRCGAGSEGAEGDGDFRGASAAGAGVGVGDADGAGLGEADGASEAGGWAAWAPVTDVDLVSSASALRPCRRTSTRERTTRAEAADTNTNRLCT
ncbi:hypothetical protein [Streptomyces sp. NPDC087212]|uniref:hypothetical protein n=1 Tax=Streptomyces sp. NPDC087212 TaxID=3365766 RepID=UPI00380C4213